MEAKVLQEQDTQSVGGDEEELLVAEDTDEVPPVKDPPAARQSKDLRARYKYNIFCRLLFL